MKLSCNGCRILRKGCNDNCVIKPCLEWINSPESQANATLFLAKFYGRTGLLNLITAAPQHLGPVVFKSLLYEACGRLVNPTYGSLGLYWAGEWARCEAAVDAVLSGSKINDHILSTCDIRYMPKRTNVDEVKGRTEFKRVRKVMIKPRTQVGSIDLTLLCKTNWKSERTQSMETSFASQDKLNQAAETDLDLELTLGFPCQSTYAN